MNMAIFAEEKSNNTMSQDYKITVAIPAYKDAFLRETIESVLSQVYENFELVIVNDASPYDLDSIISVYNDSRIRYFTNKKNCGAKDVVDNWNICLAKSAGSYFMCIGDDDRLKPNCLFDLAVLISKYPDADLLHSRTEVIDVHSNLIETLPQQSEWESVFSFVSSFNDSGLGSYLFKSKILKEEGGFYKLPYGWSSDVVSAIRAASSHGVVHTQETGFQYRASGFTISHDIKSIEDKILANQQATTFLISHLASVKNYNAEDEVLKAKIPNVIEDRMRQKNDDMIEFDIRKDFTKRAIFWLTHRKQYGVSLSRYIRCALKAIKYK